MVKSKRTNLPFRSDYTRSFIKAWERYNKAGRRDMNETAAIMARFFPVTRFLRNTTTMH